MTLRALALGHPVKPQPEDRDWSLDAACRGMGDYPWFGSEGGANRYSYGRVDEAKAICATCPVRSECLAEARENRIIHGIWGGLTPNERAAGVRFEDSVEARDEHLRSLGGKCKHDHPLSGDNLYIATDASGRRRRRCKTCRNINAAKRRTKHIPAGVHGTVGGYTNYGCREECCTEAHRKAKRRWTAQRVARRARSFHVRTNGDGR